MKKTRQPNTPYLVFLSLFFTLTLATQTTGSVNCQTGSLRYPFGFSDGYPIRFNCSKKTGDAEIGEFAVQEVTNSSIYVEIPPVCKRAIRKIEQLFRENFAPSSLQNIILFQECNQSLSDCSINREFLQDRLNLSTCNSNMTCMDGGTDITADVIRVVDVVNGSGCTYWVSSISKSEGSFKFGRLRLDWWLKERCSNTTCSANAACTDVKLADGSFGHRCTCLQGFSGNAFTVPGGCRSGSLVKRLKPIRKVVGSVAGVVLFVILLSLFLCFLRKRGKLRMSQHNLKSLIPLKHYTYAQVKRITQSFAEVIGRGGFGIVYRGTLSDGCMVAVKVLKDSKGNGEDFLNEVASMSQTSHLNIVSLLGFCSEGSKRAIIYEFLGNGSLDKFISGKTSMNLDWTALYQIALGVARGLEYLHHGCKTRIVHFDIKPQNILLDDNFCPKVSDFGLAKLCGRKESILSLLDTRGTIGYIAPEMISRVYGNVSHKSDVYSYGMLVLEMIGARNKERAYQDYASNESSIYFPEWVYRDLEAGKSRRLIESGITNETDQLAKKMTLVGLWCIQSSPLDRPPMNKVLEMMEGSLEALEVPPRPVLQHIPVAPLQESSTLSEDISG